MDRHPIKRARTTFTYLAVAMAGSDAQKAAFRRAACLCTGGVDFYRMFVGEMDDDDAEQHYREGMVLGTTLQVPPEMWPPDRAAFDRYWQESLDKVHIDDTVRDYLYPIAVGRMRGMTLPGGLQRWAEKPGLLLTTGFLPQRFRDEMHFSRDVARQRRFDRLMAVLRTVNNLMPRFIRCFPSNVLLWDLDRRIRTGRPMV